MNKNELIVKQQLEIEDLKEKLNFNKKALEDIINLLIGYMKLVEDELIREQKTREPEGTCSVITEQLRNYEAQKNI